MSYSSVLLRPIQDWLLMEILAVDLASCSLCCSAFWHYSWDVTSDKLEKIEQTCNRSLLRRAAFVWRRRQPWPKQTLLEKQQIRTLKTLYRIHIDWIAARAHAPRTTSLMMLSKRACLVRKIASLENELDFSWFSPRAGHRFWSFIQPLKFRFHPWKLDDAQLQDVSGFGRFIHGVSRRYFEVLRVF